MSVSDFGDDMLVFLKMNFCVDEKYSTPFKCFWVRNKAMHGG